MTLFKIVRVKKGFIADSHYPTREVIGDRHVGTGMAGSSCMVRSLRIPGRDNFTLRVREAAQSKDRVWPGRDIPHPVETELTE